MKMQDVGVVFNDITFIPSFVKIRPAVLKLKDADRQTPITTIIIHFMQRKHNNPQSRSFGENQQGFSLGFQSILTTGTAEAASTIIPLYMNDVLSEM
jgi:hypothetical protein